MVEVRPGCLQRLLNLLQDQLNLALERGVDEDLAGLRIGGRHARDEHLLPTRVQVDTGAPHFSKLLSIGSTRMISRFMRPFLVHVSPI